MGSDDPKPVDLTRESAHPRAREALEDAFFWDPKDPGSPFGDETGLEVLEAVRDARVDEPRGDRLEVLDELLARWEVTNEHWDVVAEDDVQALGADDEFSLLTRDEVVLAFAFAQIIVEGRVHPEVRRRAMLALARQGLPALLHGWGDRRFERATRIERMRAVLSRPWE